MTVDLIVKNLASLLPGIAAILTLIFKQVDKRALKQLTQRVQDNFESTTKMFQHIEQKVQQNRQQNLQQHQQLKQKILNTQKIMGQHTQTLSKILEQKDIAHRIRQISKHAIDYCGNRDVAKILEVVAEQFICFMKNIVQIGFENTTKQQIVTKFNVARSNVQRFSKHILRDDIVDSWKIRIAPISQQYVNQVFAIYKDHINNKTSRFIIKSEDFVQTVVREFILYTANIGQQHIKPLKIENIFEQIR